MKKVGKPDAGNPHVRFEEGDGPIGPSLLDGKPVPEPGFGAAALGA
jgi:hypothetical protein